MCRHAVSVVVVVSIIIIIVVGVVVRDEEGVGVEARVRRTEAKVRRGGWKPQMAKHATEGDDGTEV
jgi:hypothetical protein